MTWPGLAPPLDWSHVNFANAFRTAVRERYQAARIGPGPADLSVGDDVQGLSHLGVLQSCVEQCCGGVPHDVYGGGRFVVSHAAGAPLDPAVYHGRADRPDTYDTLAQAFSAAGLGYSNWRRYTVHPSDGGEVQNGHIQPGDVIGPWLFEDVKAILNVLVWTLYEAAWTSGGVVNHRWGTGNSTSWETVKAQAEAGWEAPNEEEVPSQPPFAYSWGIRPAGYVGGLNRQKAFGVAPAGVMPMPTFCKRDSDWYVKAERYVPSGGGGTFDTQGDPVLDELWSRWLVDAATEGDGVEISTQMLGTIAARPAWCDEPDWGASKSLGYAVTGYAPDRALAVVRWNVTDGFQYQ